MHLAVAVKGNAVELCLYVLHLHIFPRVKFLVSAPSNESNDTYVLERLFHMSYCPMHCKLSLRSKC